METKQCTKCKRVKSINEFYFRKDNKKYRNECKECLWALENIKKGNKLIA